MKKINIRVVDKPSNSKLNSPPFCRIEKNGIQIDNPRGLWGKKGGIIEVQDGDRWTLEIGAGFRVGRGATARTERSSEKINIVEGYHNLVKDQSQYFEVEIKNAEE